MTDRRSSWLELAENLAERVRTGKLQPGDRLPTENELRNSTGLSRTTVRHAVAEVRSRGLIKTVPQDGSFVLGSGGPFQLGPGESVTPSTALIVTGADGSIRTLAAGTRIVVDANGCACHG
ncbi:winged helix-turn-helix domain-containing protein [Rugosimonospora africana]